MNHDTVGKLVFEWHETGTTASQHGGRAGYFPTW